MKIKTNEQMLKALIKDLDTSHSIYAAILRERIIKMMELTLTSIETEPEKWNNSFIHPNMYKELNNIVQKHIGFENN